jgi:hypothetical protein
MSNLIFENALKISHANFGSGRLKSKPDSPNISFKNPRLYGHPSFYHPP